MPRSTASANALTFDGTSWSSPTTIDSGHTLESVSCATPTLCVAVDDNGNALTYDGTSWSSPASVDGGHAWTRCRVRLRRLCVAVDDSGNALTYDGTSWSTATSIDSTHVLESVSCPTANFCAAVDAVGNALTFPPAVSITTTSLPAADHRPLLLDDPGRHRRQSPVQVVGPPAEGSAHQPDHRSDLGHTRDVPDTSSSP